MTLTDAAPHWTSVRRTLAGGAAVLALAGAAWAPLSATAAESARSTAASAPTSATASTAAGTAAGTACSTVYWGSLPKSSTRQSAATVAGVRSGRHECFDRVVVDLHGAPTGYTARYVSAVHQQGSGAVVSLRGGAELELVVTAAAYDATTGAPTYGPRNPRELTDVTGYSTLRQVAWGGSFEGYSTIGIGVRARLPFRVTTLSGPGSDSRLVVDVAASW